MGLNVAKTLVDACRRIVGVRAFLILDNSDPGSEAVLSVPEYFAIPAGFLSRIDCSNYSLRE